MKSIRPIGIYLPQFHPIPENDEWWGKGFTEWTNVTKAKPLFKGHYQPHLPADLGFYDLRLAEVRAQQAALAKEYGFHGFCYYHYWFNGRRLLEKPFEEVLSSGSPDFPFMLCWANENWTRAWDGGEKQILLKQNYSTEDDKAHLQSLLPTFKDPRYIRINNKPVFAVYRSSLFPDIKQTLATWRSVAREEGLELYLCCFEALGEKKQDPKDLGFDAAIQFTPFGIIEGTPKKEGISFSRAKNSLTYRVQAFYKNNFKNANYLKYQTLVEHDLKAHPASYKQYPTVTPMWDNTSRRKRPTVFLGATPQRFGDWVRAKLKKFKPFSEEENLFFVNAWNEWAEGNHMEPCQKWGTSYLEHFRKALSDEGKT